MDIAAKIREGMRHYPVAGFALSTFALSGVFIFALLAATDPGMITGYQAGCETIPSELGFAIAISAILGLLQASVAAVLMALFRDRLIVTIKSAAALAFGFGLLCLGVAVLALSSENRTFGFAGAAVFFLPIFLANFAALVFMRANLGRAPVKPREPNAHFRGAL